MTDAFQHPLDGRTGIRQIDRGALDRKTDRLRHVQRQPDEEVELVWFHLDEPVHQALELELVRASGPHGRDEEA